MFQAVDYPDQNLLVFTIAGTLRKADYDAVIPVLEQKIARWGKVNAYLKVQSLDAVTLPALWQEIKQDVKHFNDFNRVALVSNDNSLVKTAAAVSTSVTPAQVRHFQMDQKTEALSWALGEAPEATLQARPFYAS